MARVKRSVHSKKRRNKVKLTIMFRGREMAHPELGMKILQRVADDLADTAIVESAPRQDGRNMTMVLHPTRRETRKASKEQSPGANGENGDQ